MTESISPPLPAGVSLSEAQEKVAASSGRIVGLDVLRGLAASSVLVYHYTSNYQRVYHHRAAPLFSLPQGALGVELFFLISGFVIFMTLERARRPMDFVRSRFFRLFPAYWAAICLTFVVLRLLPLIGRTPTLPRMLINLSMVQELLGVGNVDPVYWTLQLELCFYTIMLVLFCTRQLRYVEFYLLGLMLLNVARSRWMPPGSAMLKHHHLGQIIDIIKTVLILDYAYAFLIGIMIYRFVRERRAWYLAVIGLCIAYIMQDGQRIDVIATIIFTLLVAAAAMRMLDVIAIKPVLFLGTISYSLYLTHQNIGYTILIRLEHAGWNVNLAILVTATIALLVATGLTFLVEQPALRYSRRRRAAAHRTAAIA